jgi:ferredoxin
MKYLKTYEERCNGSNTCMTVCSKLYFKEDNRDKSSIKVSPDGHGGFRLNACNQCGVCVTECPALAISVNKQGVVMINRNLCINCLACVAVCPTRSMMLYRGGLVPFKCIACGSCAKQCPTDALEIILKEE